MINPKKHIKSKLCLFAFICMSFVFIPFTSLSVSAATYDSSNVINVLENATFSLPSHDPSIDVPSGSFVFEGKEDVTLKVGNAFIPRNSTIVIDVTVLTLDYPRDPPLYKFQAPAYFSMAEINFYSNSVSNGNYIFGFTPSNIVSYGNRFTCYKAVNNTTEISNFDLHIKSTFGLGYGEKLIYCLSIYAIPDNSTTNAVVNLESYLRSALSVLSGDRESNSAVANFNSIFADFNSELDNIDNFDTTVFNEFNTSNTQYLTQLSNFNLSNSVLSAGTWLSSSMQTVFDNSSDYKMLWLVPLLFGIPILIFITKKSKGDS